MSRTITAGIDPAKREFTSSFVDEQGEVLIASRNYQVTREGMDTFASRVKSLGLTEGDRLVIGVEATGSLDDNLLAYLHQMRRESPFSIVVLRLDPGQVKGFRGPRPLREKSDPVDGRKAAEFARVYAARLHEFEEDPEAQARLRLVNERAALVEDRVRWINRLHDRLVISFPEFDSVLSEVGSPLALCILEKVPTAAHAANCRACSFSRLQPRPRAHRLGLERARRLVALAKQSVASATTDEDGETVRFIVSQILALSRRIDQIDEHFKKWVDANPVEAVAQPQGGKKPHSDAPATLGQQIYLIRTIPGLRTVAGSTLVLRCRGLLRFPSAGALAAQVAACPQRSQTGSSRDTTRLTRRGDRRTRTVLYLAACSTIANDPAMAFHYWRLQRPRPDDRPGLLPFQAQWACVRRLIDVIWAICHNQTPYDPDIPLRNAQSQHPALWKTFEQTEKGKAILKRWNAKKGQIAS